MKKDIKKAVKAKAKAVKEKAKAVKAKVKAKVKGKVKAVIAMFGAMLFMVGCSSAQPASRATTADYEFTVKVSVDENAKTTTVNVPITIGDSAIQSADSKGSTETQTATPTLDIKPDVNVNYAQGGGITNRGTGGAKASGAAGILESLTAEGLAMLKDYVVNRKSGTVTLAKKDGTTVTADCKDGACTFSDGTTVTAEDCANCTDCEVKQ